MNLRNIHNTAREMERMRERITPPEEKGKSWWPSTGWWLVAIYCMLFWSVLIWALYY